MSEEKVALLCLLGVLSLGLVIYKFIGSLHGGLLSEVIRAISTYRDNKKRDQIHKLIKHSYTKTYEFTDLEEKFLQLESRVFKLEQRKKR